MTFAVDAAGNIRYSIKAFITVATLNFIFKRISLCSHESMHAHKHTLTNIDIDIKQIHIHKLTHYVCTKKQMSSCGSASFGGNELFSEAFLFLKER